jgi:hypothetical protein
MTLPRGGALSPVLELTLKRFLPFAVLLVAAACTDGAAPFAPTAESESVLLASRTSAAKESKMDVCHVDGMGNSKLINVNGNALKAHLGHGDVQPGENGCPVAGGTASFDTVGFVLDEDGNGQIGWTATGTASQVSFVIEVWSARPPPAGGFAWDEANPVQTIIGPAEGAYTSMTLPPGTYRIVAKLADGTVLDTSGDITITD